MSLSSDKSSGRDTLPTGLMIATLAIFIWSAIAPYDRLIWLLEVLPVIVAVPLLAVWYRRWRFCDLSYWLIFLHAVLLLVGGHWTYERMPLFDWLGEALELHRNHYDRVGHFAQGLIPAIVIRELLLRLSPLERGKLLASLVLACCLAISAAYELIEWSAAVILGRRADSFLGAQGDPWDTQWDMFLALCGAGVALMLLSRAHDRSMARLRKRG